MLTQDHSAWARPQPPLTMPPAPLPALPTVLSVSTSGRHKVPEKLATQPKVHADVIDARLKGLHALLLEDRDEMCHQLTVWVRMPADAVNAPGIARRLGYYRVIGTPQALEALKAANLPVGANVRYQVRVARDAGLSVEAQKWLEGYECGESALALFEACTGQAVCEPGRNRAFPQDPAAFERCLALRQHVPEIRAHLLKRAPSISRAWAALIQRWHELLGVREFPEVLAPILKQLAQLDQDAELDAHQRREVERILVQRDLRELAERMGPSGKLSSADIPTGAALKSKNQPPVGESLGSSPTMERAA